MTTGRLALAYSTQLPQHAEIGTQVHDAMDRVMSDCSFISGPDVQAAGVILSLPMHPHLTEAQPTRVVETLAASLS